MRRVIVIVVGLALMAVSGLAVREASGGGSKVDQRVFEMRTYYAAPGKMKDLEDRFRNHTNKLFVKHGMTIIGFWTPIPAKADKKVDDHKLVYILAYPSLDAAHKSWDAFRKDPDWVAAKKASEPDGKSLVTKVDSEFLKPTDYSPIK